MTITGPFSTTFESTDKQAYWRRITYRQTKPRVSRLWYSFVAKWVDLEINPFFPYDGIDASGIPYPPGVTANSVAYSKALNKFTDSIGEGASLGVSLGERKQAVDMIVGRAKQLTLFARSLRKGHFENAANALGYTLRDVPIRRTRRQERKRDKKFSFSGQPLKKFPRRYEPKPSRAKGFASNYLEFHFGWSPLVGDIFAAVNVLGDGIPPVIVKGRGNDHQTKHVQDVSWEYRDYDITSKVQIIADCRIINPNVNLLSQLGLTNPASVVWELVPFSFVWDWFSNVGQFLTSWSNYTGVTLSNSAVTYLDNWTWTRVQPSTGLLFKGHAVSCDRRPFTGTPPTPRLILYPFKGFSVRRGLAAISLLIQQLK